MNNFSGALEKEGMVLPLFGQEAIYFDSSWNPSYQKKETSVLLACYDQDKEMYLLQPLRKLSIYLESGQPLGEKPYYIPRNTRILINEDRPALFM